MLVASFVYRAQAKVFFSFLVRACVNLWLMLGQRRHHRAEVLSNEMSIGWFGWICMKLEYHILWKCVAMFRNGIEICATESEWQKRHIPTQHKQVKQWNLVN